MAERWSDEFAARVREWCDAMGDLAVDALVYFGRMRNPNYLGEILIYFSYAILSMHWLPFVILAGWVFGFFARNMAAKDRSLSRHPGFEDYRKSSGLLFPRLF